MRQALIVLLLAACASQQPYLWVSEYRAPAVAPVTPLRTGDRVQVVVQGQEAMSGDFEVRPDGDIVIPVVGRVVAAGATAEGVAALVTTRLRGVVADPKVTAVVTLRRLGTVSVLGEVKTPGRYDLRDEDGLMDGLARAGGLTEYADRDAIFVVRRSLPASRIRFRYRDLIRGDPPSVGFRLRDTDVIVVE